MYAAICCLQHHSQEVIAYILQSSSENDEDLLRFSDTLNLIKLQHWILNNLNYLFPKRRNKRIPSVLSFQISDFLAALSLIRLRRQGNGFGFKIPPFHL